MQTISIQHLLTERINKSSSFSITKWLETIKPSIIENRFGVVVTLIILSFTVAGFNVCIPPMANAPVYMWAPGVFMAFASNSIALAQARMKWVLIGFALSILINGLVSIYYAIQLLIG